MRDDQLRFQDVLVATKHIRKYAIQGREAFFEDEMLQVWILYHLQIIGEALASTSPEFRSANADWLKPIIGMRNILVHKYFGINLEAAWNVVENRLDDLQTRVEALLEPPSDDSA